MLNRLSTKINKSYKAHQLVQPLRSFRLQNKQYRYFCHRYNTAHANERAVELPIIWSQVQQYPSNQVLEIGNVLSHYFPTSHQVVDKYEVAPGVINQDIVDFAPQRKFKFIVSISTLEHVGWDESVHSKQKILHALRKIKSLLAPKGTALITLPLGYNQYLDEHLAANRICFDTAYFLQRISAFNSWQQVPKSILKKHPQYNYPFPNANVIVIGKYRG